MAHPNEVLIRKAYDAFDKGDMDALRGLFAPDIIGHEAGKSPIAGDYKGVDEVFGLFAKVFELSGGTYKVQLHEALATDTHAVVLSKGTAARGSKTLSENSVDVFHLAGGKITEFWALSDDQYATDEFWS